MITQYFTITDIQRTKVGDGGVAAVTMTPVPTGEPAVQPPMPYGIGTMNPSPIRMTGVPVADVEGWALDDTLTFTIVKNA